MSAAYMKKKKKNEFWSSFAPPNTAVFVIRETRLYIPQKRKHVLSFFSNDHQPNCAADKLLTYPVT